MSTDTKYRVGIVGCGKILIRHTESIELNPDFSLAALCDTDAEILEKATKKHKVNGYANLEDMIEKEDINFVVIATPNSLHHHQAKYCLRNNCDVLIEKPASLSPEKSREVEKVAKDNNQKAYAVLQVRLNPVVEKIKDILEQGFMGKVRGFSLTQRWQRPAEYFQDWRGKPNIGGGTLHECGVHYIDILCHLLGKPEVYSSVCYNTKHKSVSIEDTVYSLLGFDDFGGTMEVTIAAEPKNIECSITIMTEFGFIKLGGKALDKITKVQFLENKKEIREKYDKVMLQLKQSKETNSYGNYKGSCPNHPELYSRLGEFDISVCFQSLDLIKEIYNKCGKKI